MAYYREIFEAIDIAELPPFHNAFRCQHSERFKEMYDDAKRRGLIWDHYDEQKIGQQFTKTLTSDDRAVCSYHKADWAAIADESVGIIRKLGQRDTWAYEEAARDSDLEGQELRWLLSLFEYPIKVYDGSYGDGQHRGCALRFSGAAQVAVVVRTERVK